MLKLLAERLWKNRNITWSQGITLQVTEGKKCTVGVTTLTKWSSLEEQQSQTVREAMGGTKHHLRGVLQCAVWG